MPGEYKKFLRLTHAAKSASIPSIAQTGNACYYLTHSLGPWILDFSASNHLSGNKDLFSSLTITSPLPTLLWLMGLKPWLKETGLPVPSPLYLLLLLSMSLILHLILSLSIN